MWSCGRAAAGRVGVLLGAADGGGSCSPTGWCQRNGQQHSGSKVPEKLWRMRHGPQTSWRGSASPPPPEQERWNDFRMRENILQGFKWLEWVTFVSLNVTYSAARSDPVGQSQSRQSYSHCQHHQQFDSSGLLSQAGQIFIPDTQQLLLAVRMSHKLKVIDITE